MQSLIPKVRINYLFTFSIILMLTNTGLKKVNKHSEEGKEKQSIK